MWGRFSRKEQDLGALQKVLKRFRSPSARREGLIIVYRGNAVRLGVVVLLILVIVSSLISCFQEEPEKKKPHSPHHRPRRKT